MFKVLIYFSGSSPSDLDIFLLDELWEKAEFDWDSLNGEFCSIKSIKGNQLEGLDKFVSDNWFSIKRLNAKELSNFSSLGIIMCGVYE